MKSTALVLPTDTIIMELMCGTHVSKDLLKELVELVIWSIIETATMNGIEAIYAERPRRYMDSDDYLGEMLETYFGNGYLYDRKPQGPQDGIIPIGELTKMSSFIKEHLPTEDDLWAISDRTLVRRPDVKWVKDTMVLVL